jgi:hypothetical protein
VSTFFYLASLFEGALLKGMMLIFYHDSSFIDADIYSNMDQLVLFSSGPRIFL